MPLVGPPDHLDRPPLPSETLVPIVRVQKLEAQMAMLMHDIQPCMQKSITEAEERIEKKMAPQTKRQIMQVHQHLNVFELRVLARPAPSLDLTTLQVVVASLRENMDAILDPRVPESEAPSTNPAEDTVMATLFSTTVAPSPQPCEHRKRH